MPSAAEAAELLSPVLVPMLLEEAELAPGSSPIWTRWRRLAWQVQPGGAGAVALAE